MTSVHFYSNTVSWTYLYASQHNVLGYNMSITEKNHFTDYT